MSGTTLQIKVGKQIQKLRELKGLSQQDLANIWQGTLPERE